jgi:hypothetical protein
MLWHRLPPGHAESMWPKQGRSIQACVVQNASDNLAEWGILGASNGDFDSRSFNILSSEDCELSFVLASNS